MGYYYQFYQKLKIIEEYNEEFYNNNSEKNGWNGHILRNTGITKSESRRNREPDEIYNNKDIESVIKWSFNKESPGSESFAGKFYQTFKEALTPILLQLLKNRGWGNIFSHFMRPPLSRN